MKIGDIKTSLAPLLDDAFEAEEYLKLHFTSQFARRVYIRSVFSYIEGAIWIFKQVCLNARPYNSSRRIISISEFIIMNEESYELKSNGEIKTISKNLNIIDNIKFTYKRINKYFGGQIDIGIGTKSWTNLQEAKNIRNRITHPKKNEDMTITDIEIKVCQEVCSWFNLLSMKTFELFLESGKSKEVI